MTYYDVLDLSPDATHADIKQAYRTLAMRHHPDRGGDAECFALVSAAYTVLSNCAARREYDASIVVPCAKNKDISIAVELELEQLVSGAEIVGQYTQLSGSVKEVLLTIPPHAPVDGSIKYHGLGDTQNSAADAGDLIVKIKAAPHSKWSIANNNVISEIPVSAIQCVTGTSVQVELLDGRVVTVNIPKGTQHSTVLRVPKGGITTARNKTIGDALLIVSVTIPVVENINILHTLQDIHNEIVNSSASTA
jgi:DnaJ-class molecular chaperone